MERTGKSFRRVEVTICPAKEANKTKIEKMVKFCTKETFVTSVSVVSVKLKNATSVVNSWWNG